MSNNDHPDRTLPAQESDGGTRTWKDSLGALSRLAVVLLVMATLAGFTARYSIWTELFVHFKLVYFMAATVFLVIFICLKRWLLTSVCAALIGVHGVGIVPWYIPHSIDESDSDQILTILVANVLSSNSNHDAVVEYIRVRQPNIALLQEVTPALLSSLRALESDGYQVAGEARFDNFGMATLTNAQQATIGRTDLTKLLNAFPSSYTSDETESLIRNLPVMHVELKVNNRIIHVLNLHPLPPLGLKNATVRNQMLSLAGEYAVQSKDLTIIGGDLNVTPFSPNYQDAFENSDLKNVRMGHGVFPTYPTLGLLFPLIPIDHILVSNEIGVIRLDDTPEWGSDHAGLWVELAIPEN